MPIQLPTDISHCLEHGERFSDGMVPRIKQLVGRQFPQYLNMLNLYLQKYQAATVPERKSMAAMIRAFVK